MTIKYKKRNYEGKLDSIYMYDDADSNVNLSIPVNEENTDYQAYLAWVAEGNTADPPD